MSSLQEKNLLIDGPVGQLEALFMHNDESAIKKIAIICHPHPLYGGTMQNKVITTLARTYRDLNIPSIRFNYRGVGKSEGSYNNGIGETEDALAVISFAQEKWPESELWLAGFSFGAFVSLRAADVLRQQENTSLKHLVSIAPAVNHADFSQLYPPCPWLIIQGEKDEVVPAEEVKTWAKTLHGATELLSLPNANHFFDGELVTLRQLLNEKLTHAHTT